MKNGLEASGFITLPMISIPSKRSPKEKITRPTLRTFSRFARKLIRKPAKMIG